MKTRQLSRTLQQITSKSKLEEIDYFEDTFFLFLYKKVIRITEGLYLITNHIEESEPIRSQIRSYAIEAVEASIRIKNKKNTEDDTVLYRSLLTCMASILSLLEVAVVAGLINEANYFLLDREVGLITSNVAEKMKNCGHSNVSMGPSFFDVEIESRRTQKIKDINSKGHIVKDMTETGGLKSEIIKDSKHNTPDSIIVAVSGTKKRQSGSYNKGEINDMSRSGGKKNARDVLRTIERESKTSSVLDFLKDNRRVSIKDIILSLPQYSEKTIQRELLRLVQNGLIVKEGVKRWTFYSFFQKS